MWIEAPYQAYTTRLPCSHALSIVAPTTLLVINLEELRYKYRQMFTMHTVF
jgi:hypothetical protein